MGDLAGCTIPFPDHFLFTDYDEMIQNPEPIKIYISMGSNTHIIMSPGNITMLEKNLISNSFEISKGIPSETQNKADYLKMQEILNFSSL